jgi:hypothetical protein
MSSEVYERIRKNPKFDELVAKRSRFRLDADGCGAGHLLHFHHGRGVQPETAGHAHLGRRQSLHRLAHRRGMILLFWLMTGLYVRRANSEFDDINSEIIKGAIE